MSYRDSQMTNADGTAYSGGYTGRSVYGEGQFGGSADPNNSIPNGRSGGGGGSHTKHTQAVAQTLLNVLQPRPRPRVVPPVEIVSPPELFPMPPVPGSVVPNYNTYPSAATVNKHRGIGAVFGPRPPNAGFRPTYTPSPVNDFMTMLRNPKGNPVIGPRPFHTWPSNGTGSTFTSWPTMPGLDFWRSNANSANPMRQYPNVSSTSPDGLTEAQREIQRAFENNTLTNVNLNGGTPHWWNG